MEQRGKERGAFSCLELLSTKWVAVSESVTVRSEVRSIYTPSENPTVQIYVGSSDADLGTSDDNRKHCSRRTEVSACKSVSELPTNVGTSDRRDSRCTSGLSTMELEASQWKVPELSTVGTFDTPKPEKILYVFV